MDVERNYYVVLGVDHSADAEEIRSAYRSLVRRYHPDVASGAEATMLFRQIQEAYEVVGDEVQREVYDRIRRERGLAEDAGIVLSTTLSHSVLPALSEDQLIYVLLEARPSEAIVAKQAPLNLAVVLDRSVSMKGRKLRYSKDAIASILESLGERDSISLVVFSDRAEVIQSSSRGVSKEKLQMLMRKVRADGGTELLQGLTAGVDQIHRGWSSESINHLVLLTDGRTYGDAQECLTKAHNMLQEGINLTVVGIGDDWDDELIDGIAEGSGGRSIYADTPEAIVQAVLQSVQGMQRVYARGVKTIVHLSEGARIRDAFRVTSEISRLPRNQDGYNLGALRVDDGLGFLLEICLPPAGEGERALIQLEVVGDIPSLNTRQERARRELYIEFASPGQIGNHEIPIEITEIMRKLIPFRLQERAWADLKEGNAEQATRRLNAVATRLLDAGEDRLAGLMLVEANAARKTGRMSPEGRKRMKYGTKRLVSSHRSPQK
jgi:Ca-activated chloride channel family protein